MKESNKSKENENNENITEESKEHVIESKENEFEFVE